MATWAEFKEAVEKKIKEKGLKPEEVEINYIDINSYFDEDDIWINEHDCLEIC